MQTANAQPFVRDPASRGLVNRDVKSLLAYRASRNDRAKIDNLETEINTVRSELELIRGMLQQLIQQKG